MADTGDLTFIFCTDFHGNEDKYDRTLEEAAGRGVSLILNGGDMCPHRGGKAFLEAFFPPWLKRAGDLGIRVAGMFGNDDLKAYLHYLDGLEAAGLFTRIDGRTVDIEGWKFWGYNFVPEYPFGLKDWVKLDHEGATRPPQFSDPVLSTGDGYIAIEDIEKFLHDRGTIEEELRNVTFEDPARTLAVIHSPPLGKGLDVCMDGREVGSRAILEFLEREQPRVSLHGHIHESPQVSGAWKVDIGGTLALQPGQEPIRVTLSNNGVEADYLW